MRNKVTYSLILLLIVGPPILFAAFAVYAAQSTDVTLNASEAEDVWAVVIGISDYGDSQNNLHGAPVNSAKMIYSTLVDVYKWPESHIRLLLDEENKAYDDVTKREINDVMDWLANQEDQDDTVLFYYSGHGSRDKAGEPEYITLNGAQSLSGYISDDEMVDMLNQLQSNRLIVVLDNCFSGGFAWDGANTGDLAKDGRIIIASSREDEYSYAVGYEDGTVWKERFTSHFVEGLTKRNTLERAFQYAQEKTVQTSQATMPQHPQIYDGINPERINLDVIGRLLGTVALIGGSSLGLVVFRNRRKQSPSQPQILPSAYVCPVCNENLMWIPQHQRLYCPNCKKQIN